MLLVVGAGVEFGKDPSASALVPRIFGGVHFVAGVRETTDETTVLLVDAIFHPELCDFTEF